MVVVVVVTMVVAMQSMHKLNDLCGCFVALLLVWVCVCGYWRKATQYWMEVHCMQSIQPSWWSVV